MSEHKWCTHGADASAADTVASVEQARDQLARYKQERALPGAIEPLTDEMVQYREVVIVVGNEDELQQFRISVAHRYHRESFGKAVWHVHARGYL
mgnify:CR=1 FL=1